MPSTNAWSCIFKVPCWPSPYKHYWRFIHSDKNKKNTGYKYFSLFVQPSYIFFSFFSGSPFGHIYIYLSLSTIWQNLPVMSQSLHIAILHLNHINTFPCYFFNFLLGSGSLWGRIHVTSTTKKQCRSDIRIFTIIYLLPLLFLPQTYIVQADVSNKLHLFILLMGRHLAICFIPFTIRLQHRTKVL